MAQLVAFFDVHVIVTAVSAGVVEVERLAATVGAAEDGLLPVTVPVPIPEEVEVLSSETAVPLPPQPVVITATRVTSK
jgi:hypothetical protein